MDFRENPRQVLAPHASVAHALASTGFSRFSRCMLLLAAHRRLFMQAWPLWAGTLISVRGRNPFCELSGTGWKEGRQRTHRWREPEDSTFCTP